MNYENLLKTLDIKGLSLKNRIIFNALVTKLVEENGEVTDELIDFHVARAKGGAGLNIVEIASVHEASAMNDYLSIANDDFIPGIEKLINGVHEAGGKIGIQLWQAGLASYLDDKEVIIPSKYELEDGKNLESATKEQIKEVVKSFGKATERVVQAGIDMIEIHVGLNDSINMFLNSETNKRKDEYGGSLEKRTKLLKDVIKEVRKYMPEEMPLSLRLVTKDEYIPGGLTADEIIEIVNLVKDEGVDIVNATRGSITTPAIKYDMPPVEVKKGFNVEKIERIKKETGLMTITAGRITDPDHAEEILKEEKSDLIGMNRALLVDPDFCLKVKEDRVEDIVPCIGCHQGCYDIFTDQDDIILINDKYKISCMRNPIIGQESRYIMEDTEDPQKVAVVGGGIGGLEAAKVLKQRGHEPIIFEKRDNLGGQLILAGEMIGKESLDNALSVLIDQLKRLDIEIRLNEDFETKTIVDEKFDSVIIATGSEPKESGIKGEKSKNVVKGRDILEGKAEVSGNVIIVGGGFIGLAVAELLASNPDNEIMIMDKSEKIGPGLIGIRRDCILEKLKNTDAKIKTDAECIEIKDDKIIFQNAKEEKSEVPAENIVLATGSESVKSNYIKQYCQDREIPFYVIGDALIPRKAQDAIAEAYNISFFEIE